MVEIVQPSEIQFDVRLHRLLLMSNLLTMYLEEVIEEDIHLTFKLKPEGKRVYKYFSNFIDTTYESFKSKFGKHKYSKFGANITDNCSEVYAKLENLNLTQIEQLIIFSIILEDDLKYLLDYDLLEIPQLYSIIRSFLKELRLKNKSFYETFNDIVKFNRYYIKHKNLYDFNTVLNNIKVAR